MNRSGGISIVRLGLLAGGIGLLLVVLGVAAFMGDQASRRGPFNIDPYPGAEPWGTGTITSSSRELFYLVSNATPDQVLQYYQQKLNQHTGSSQDRCVRTPPVGEAPMSRSNPSLIPYQFTCVFDNSGIGATQYTTVLIYPGTPHNEDPFLNSAGKTVILYEQHWQP